MAKENNDKPDLMKFTIQKLENQLVGAQQTLVEIGWDPKLKEQSESISHAITHIQQEMLPDLKETHNHGNTD